MKIVVFGATGGSGRAALEELLARGHEVTAFVRGDAATLPAGARSVRGDVMNAADVERAVQGQDAVIVALGISENPLRVRLFGPARTPADVRSIGTRGVRTYSVAPSRPASSAVVKRKTIDRGSGSSSRRNARAISRTAPTPLALSYAPLKMESPFVGAPMPR